MSRTEATITRIWLGTHSSNENFNGDCDLACVGMTRELAQRILRVHAAVRVACEALNDKYVELVIHDCSVDFYNLDWDGAEEIEALIAGKDFTVMDNVPENSLPPEEFKQRTEYDKLHVWRDECYWDFSPKHSEVDMETRTIPMDIIREIAEAAA